MSCCNIPPTCLPGAGRVIPPFIGFTEFTPTIPKMYWDVHSQEQRIHRICDMLDKLICYADFLGDELEINIEDVKALQAEFQEFKESGFEDYYLAQIEQWVNDNLETLYALLVKQVYFGLTQDDDPAGGGRFVAYIPESWDDIIFDTGIVYGNDEYGRLILRWDVDNSGEAVNQRPENWDEINGGI